MQKKKFIWSIAFLFVVCTIIFGEQINKDKRLHETVKPDKGAKYHQCVNPGDDCVIKL